MEGYKHPDTPQKARLLALIDHNKRTLIPRPKTALFAEAGVSKSAGYRILKSGDPRTFKNQDHSETRGRPHKITPQQSRRMVEVAETGGFDLATQTYGQLAACAEVTNVCSRTIKNSLPSTYRKHPAALRKAVSKTLADARVNWCLAAQSWFNEYILKLRWSDECHFGLGAQK